MTASDHLNRDQFIGPFYHGSQHDFPEGHELTVEGATDYLKSQGVHSPSRGIYVTSDMGLARTMARIGADAGHVYRVEPTGPMSPDPEMTYESFQPNSFITQHPVRVTRKISGWAMKRER